MAGVVKLSGLRPWVPVCRHGWSCPTPHAVSETSSAYPGGRDKSPSRQVSEPIDVRRLCDDFMIGWHQDPGVDAALAQGWWQAGRCFPSPPALARPATSLVTKSDFTGGNRSPSGRNPRYQIIRGLGDQCLERRTRLALRTWRGSIVGNKRDSHVTK
jgi:hypothetical protein